MEGGALATANLLETYDLVGRRVDGRVDMAEREAYFGWRERAAFFESLIHSFDYLLSPY